MGHSKDMQAPAFWRFRSSNGFIVFSVSFAIFVDVLLYGCIGEYPRFECYVCCRRDEFGANVWEFSAVCWGLEYLLSVVALADGGYRVFPFTLESRSGVPEEQGM